ncbi:MAG: M28 family peptidase [Bacteroidota bacterium]
MRNSIFGMIFCFLIPVLVKGQDHPVTLYAESINGAEMKAHLSFLADDLLEGRETGERGQHLAGQYIAAQFAKFGLDPGVPEPLSYHMPYYLINRKIESLNMVLGRKTYEFRRNFFTFGAYGTPSELNGDFVFAGYGLKGDGYDNLSGLDLSGKIALIFSGGPGSDGTQPLRVQVQEWFERAKNLKAAGATGAFVMLPDTIYDKLAPYARKRSVLTASDQQGKFPYFYLSEGMATDLLKYAKTTPEKLKSELSVSPKPTALSFRKLKFDYQADITQKDVEASNVLGYLEGTDKKEELLVITAHYDHLGKKKNKVYNGADDDGSGTSALLELAEAFSLAAKAGTRPRRSILFMAVSGEEKGLLGSAYYTDNPIYPLENTVSNLNIDMIGRIDKEYEGTKDSVNYVYVIGSDKLSTELHQLSEAANEQHSGLILDYRYNDEDDPNRYYYRSDHYNFAKNKIPVIFYFTGVHKDYHRPTDTLEKLHYGKMQRITRLVFHTAWEIANRDSRPAVNVEQREGD